MTLKLDPENPLATKVQTRDGRKARILCVDCKTDKYTIVGLITMPSGKEYTESWTPDGSAYIASPCEDDLINIPETQSWWVPVMKGNCLGAPWIDKDGAAQTAKMYGGERLIEIRMCNGEHVKTIQHEIDK